MRARFIDVERLKRTFASGIRVYDGMCRIDDVMHNIENEPTADVVEVKHGEWQLKSETHRYLEEIDEEFYVECPFCHRVYHIPFEFEDEKMLEYARKNYPYCNCGAKMDGGKANDL